MLDKEVLIRNCQSELSFDKPDPLMIARKYNDEYISLICALFAYGNANKIVGFLSSLDFSFLESSEDIIKKELRNHYYRFQNTQDISSFFIAIKRLKEIDSLENIFKKGYDKEANILEGIASIIQSVLEVYEYYSEGYKFFSWNTTKKR